MPATVCQGQGGLPADLDLNGDGELDEDELFPDAVRITPGGSGGADFPLWIIGVIVGVVGFCCCFILGVCYTYRKQRRSDSAASGAGPQIMISTGAGGRRRANSAELNKKMKRKEYLQKRAEYSRTTTAKDLAGKGSKKGAAQVATAASKGDLALAPSSPSTAMGAYSGGDAVTKPGLSLKGLTQSRKALKDSEGGSRGKPPLQMESSKGSRGTRTTRSTEPTSPELFTTMAI